MGRLERIQTLQKRYIENCLEYSALNDAMFQKVDFDEWNTMLMTRSEKIRKIFQDNEVLVEKMKKLLSENLTKEVADSLFQLMLDMNQLAISDASMTLMVMNSLIEFYEREGDLGKTIFLQVLCAHEETEFFVRIYGNNGLVDPRSRYLKVIGYKEQYVSLERPGSRRSIFLAYYNLIGSLPDVVPEYRKDSLRYYFEAMELWNSHEAQSLDGDKEEFRQVIRQLNVLVINLFTRYLMDEMTDEDVYFSILRDLMENQTECVPTDMRKVIQIIIDYNERRISKKEFMEKLFDFFVVLSKAVPHYERSFEGITRFCLVENIAYTVLRLLRTVDEEEFVADTYRKRIKRYFIDYLGTVPYKDYTYFFDETANEVFSNLVYFEENEDDKLTVLQELVIQRQPLTYFHSAMVREIARMIALVAIEQKPELFESLKRCGMNDKDSIMNYVMNAAFIHDIGKCMTAGLVNLQSRKLTNQEFEMIKLHSAKGLDITNKDYSFGKYYDVMLGHHKSYDGKNGYPVTFNNTKSSYRIVIDLVSIADSIDAATDYYGRNYAHGKSFFSTLQELVEGKGTRYNPDLVEVLEENEALQKELEYITSEGRNRIYYDCYNIMFRRK